MLCNKAQFFVFFEVCLNPHLFTSLRTVFNTQKHTKTKWLSGTCVPSLLKEQRHRVTTPVKNRLTINHASEITLLISSFTAIPVIKCSYESHDRKKQNKIQKQIGKRDKNLRAFHRDRK